MIVEESPPLMALVPLDDVDTEIAVPSHAGVARRVLVIACGALAREVLALNLDAIDLACLPASLHNRPKRIPEAMREKIRANRDAYDEILCLYGDCGTGGELDRVLAKRASGASRGRTATPSLLAKRRLRRSPRRSPARSTSPISSPGNSTRW